MKHTNMENMFKRFLSLALAVLMVVSMMPTTAFATETETGDNTQTETGTETPVDGDGTDDGEVAAQAEENSLVYAVVDGAAQVTDGKSAVGDVVIPEKVTIDGVEYAVTSVAGNAFNDANEVTSIVIPNSVTSLGGAAFANMDKLKSITIGNGVTSWGSKLAVNNYELETVVIAEGATLIGDLAFRTCPKLANLTLPSTLKKIGATAFAYSAITELVLPAGLESIGADSFKDIDTLKKVTFLGENTQLGSTCFQMCDGLEEVVLPAKLTVIPQGAFRYCTSLKTINFPESLTEIGNYSFQGCTSLESVTISKNITNLVTNAFNGCTSLKNLTIEEGFAGTIGGYVFQGCTALESVVIPSTMETVGESMFNECTSLKNVTLSEGVKTLNISAFANCTSLETLVLPDSLERMRHGSIANCTALKTLVVTGENLPVIEHSNALEGLSEDLVVVYTGDDEFTGNWAALADNVTDEMPKAYVAQVGETKYESLAEAVAAANGATVTLLQNVTLDKMLTISGNVTISGAYTITRDAAYTGTLFEVAAGATLTLDGGLVVDGGNAWTYTKTPLEMDMENGAGTKVADHITPAEGGVNATAHLIVNNGTLNANKVTIQNSYSTNGVSVINCGASSVTTLDGATIRNTAANRSGAVVYVGGADAVLTIKGDTRITGNFGIGNGGIIQNYGQGSTVNLEAGSIDNNHVGSSGTVYASYSGNASKINTFNMSGGIITKNIMEGYGPVYIHTNTVWNMTGGEISENTSFLPSYVRSNNNAATISGGKIVNNEITGVNYNSGYYVTRPDIYLGTNSKITGGTYTQDVTEYLAADTGLAYDEETGTYSVTDHVYNLYFRDPVTGEQVQGVGPLKGNNLASLIATGKLFYADYYKMELEVLCDVKVDETAVIDYPMTINLNGHTITTVATEAGNYMDAFTILADVTVTGEGKINARPSHGYTFYIGDKNGNAGNLTIENGTFYGETSVVNNRLGTVTINGGKFAISLETEGDTYDFVLNCIDANYNAGTAKIVVKGGTFYKFNPADNEAEIGDHTNFVAEGYISEELTEGYFTVRQVKYVAELNGVKYESLQAAVDAAMPGDTITVIADHEMDCGNLVTNSGGYSVLVNVAEKAVTIDLNGKTITVSPKAEQFTNATNTMLMGVFAVDTNGTLTLKDSVGTGKVDVTANDATVYSLAVCYGEGGKLNIESGSYSLDVGGNGRGMIYSQYDEVVTVTGGNFHLGNVGTLENGSPWIFNTSGQNTKNIIVVGGTYNADIFHQYYIFEVKDTTEVAELLGVPAKAAKANSDGTWTVVDAVAYVDEQHKSGKWYTQNTGYATLEEAIAASGKYAYGDKGYTVTLVDDAEVTGNVVVTEGKTLVCGDYSVVLAAADATLTAPEDLNVTTSVENATVEYTEGVYSVKEFDYVLWVKEQLLAGNDVTLDRDITVGYEYVDSVDCTANGNGQYKNWGIFTVISGDVTFDLNGHNVTFEGHSDEFCNNVAFALFYANNGGKLTVTGEGNVTVNGMATGAYSTCVGSELTIEGGNWVNNPCTECDAWNIFLYASHGGALYIKDGSFAQNVEDNYLIVEHTGNVSNNDALVDYSKTVVEITGGSFKGMNPEEARSCNQKTWNSQEWGTTNVVAKGYEAVDNGDGTWTVVPTKLVKIEVEAIPGTWLTNYVTIENWADLEAALGENTNLPVKVTLLEDVELTKFLTITGNKTVELNLNGKTITREGGTALYINGEGTTVTINGNGTVKGQQALYVNAGKVIVENGTFVGEDSHAVYVINNGHVEIYGGTFSSDLVDFLLNEYDATRDATSITVYGGTFVGFNPENNAAEGAGTNFVAKGYKSKDNGDGTWTVVPNMIFEMHLVDANGDAHWLSPMRSNDLNSLIENSKVWYESLQGTYSFTLKILESYELDETVLATFPMTIDLCGKTLTVAKTMNATPAIRVLSDVTVKNGTVDATAGSSTYAFIVGNSTTAGALTIVDGTYKGRVSVASVTKGTLTIEGGNFEATEYEGAHEFTLNCIDANYTAGTAKIVVKGGTFVGFNPENNAAEGAGTNFVAEGYGAEQDGENYIVKPVITVTFDNLTMVEGNELPEFTYTTNFTEIAEDGMMLIVEEPAVTVNGVGEYEITAEASVFMSDAYIVRVTPGTLTVVEAVAQVGNVYYASLQEAINACTNGETVKLIADITYDADDVVNAIGGPTGYGDYPNPSIIYVGGTKGATDDENQPSNVNAVIDLNGHTITNNADAYLFLFMDNCKITFKDSVGTGAVVGNSEAPVIWSTGTETVVTIESGKYSIGEYGSLIWATHSGDLVIKGGEFSTTAEDASCLIMRNEQNRQNSKFFITGKSVVTVTGGTFHGFNPEKMLDDSKTPAYEFNAVAEGYVAVADEEANTWTVMTVIEAGYVAQNTADGVYYKTVAEALKAAVSGETVILITNASEGYVMVTPGTTLDLNGYTLTADYVVGFNGSNVVDNSEANTGLLVVADAKNVVLAETNSQLPVWTGEGYIFVEILKFNTIYYEDNMQYVFQPVFEEAAHEYLLAGMATSKVKIAARMSWTTSTGMVDQDFVYIDEQVQMVVNSYNASTGKYSKAYSLTLTSVDQADFTLNVVVISETGVELATN